MNSPQCLVCGTALAGPLGLAFRAFGIQRSPRNPNVCSRCNTHAEEGRVVNLTVFFADLSGFTTLTRELGPERTHEVVDAFLRQATEILVKHGAFIDKYIGDAVMAFFNAPIRAEDHCDRAVAAAREIQAELPKLSARLGLELHSTIGIATGFARVGRLGSADGRDYTAIGDVVNLAARLQAQARPGEVMLHEEVYQALTTKISNATVESLPLKGFAEPVPAWRLRANDAAHSGAEPLPVSAHPTARRPMSLGAVIFAVLGAPCAVTTLVGPLAAAVGMGSSFSAIAPRIFPVLDQWPLRIPLLTLGLAGVLANLYTVWQARMIRRQAAVAGAPVPLTRLEVRRTRFALGLAVFALLAIGYELYAHEFVKHHSWP